MQNLKRGNRFHSDDSFVAFARGNCSVPVTTSLVDWTTWQPKEEATVLYVVCDGRVLLIEKKRGLGAGKINGPGGRVEAGENEQGAAIREFEEEVQATPVGVEKCGELWFHVLRGPAIRIHVFRASDCVGEPRETAEATPFWSDVDSMPYDRMWADDRYWFPLLLAGRAFEARTIFDGDRLLEWELEEKGPDHVWC